MDYGLSDWILFGVIILALFVLDLGVLHRKQKVIGSKESILMWLFYASIGLLFGGWIWYNHGSIKAEEYVTGFVVETSLAIDNIFIISIIFNFLSIPLKNQHRVLFLGIMGVIVLRGVVIGFGSLLVTKLESLLYIFGIFLVFTGFKMLFMKEKNVNIENNIILKILHKYLPITKELEGDRFYIKKTLSDGTKAIYYTPLFVALVLIESIDLVFAFDSIPAIFSITTDPFIVYTSNIFATMGLRSLYFALAAILNNFAYLKHAVALVLIFIGSKIFIADLLDLEKFPASISLSVTIGLLVGGVLYSIYKKSNR